MSYTPEDIDSFISASPALDTDECLNSILKYDENMTKETLHIKTEEPAQTELIVEPINLILPDESNDQTYEHGSNIAPATIPTLEEIKAHAREQIRKYHNKRRNTYKNKKRNEKKKIRKEELEQSVMVQMDKKI